MDAFSVLWLDSSGMSLCYHENTDGRSLDQASYLPPVTNVIDRTSSYIYRCD